MTDPLTPIVEAVLRLTEQASQQVSMAAQKGAHALTSLSYELAAATQLASAVSAAISAGVAPDRVAGVVQGAAAAARATRALQQVSMVWSGPSSTVQGGRLTAAGVKEVIDSATSSLLLIGYVVHADPTIRDATAAAVERGVAVTVLLERPEDNASFTGHREPFKDLAVRRLAWPAHQRPDEKANLHAKVLVADRRTALVGSANITGWAFDRNLECGVMIRGGEHPESIARHVEELRINGVLVRVS